MSDRQVTLAAIAGAHGIGGEVRLKLFGEDVTALKKHRQFNVDGQLLSLSALRPDKGGAIARFAEVSDRTTAEKLRGKTLGVARSELPALAEDEYYHVDLIGLPCISTEDEPLGHVVAIENFGAGDVAEIERPDGRRFMVPLSREAVPDMAGRLLINAAFAAV